MANLPPQQIKFCEEYLVDMNATQAAVRAGYSLKTAVPQGKRLLEMAEIQARLTQRMQEIRSASIATVDELLAYLTGILRGESMLAKPPDEKDRLKACELLGKHYGMFTDKVNLRGAPPIVISGGNDLED